MCNDRRMFKNLRKSTENNVLVGDGKSLSVCGKGDVIINLDSGMGRAKRCRVKNVLFVPNLPHNLLSVSKLSQCGKSVVFDNNMCKIVHEEKTVAYGNKIGDLYVLAQKVPHRSYALSATCLTSSVSRRFIRCQNFSNCCHASCHV